MSDGISLNKKILVVKQLVNKICNNYICICPTGRSAGSSHRDSRIIIQETSWTLNQVGFIIVWMSDQNSAENVKVKKEEKNYHKELQQVLANLQIPG